MKTLIVKVIIFLALSIVASNAFATTLNLKGILDKNIYTTTAVRSDRENLRTLGQELSDLAASFSAYPNPVRDIVHFEWKNQSISKIEISDMHGKLLHAEYSQHPNVSEMDFDMSRFDTGIYFVRAFNVIGNSVTLKVVKKN